MEKPSSMTEEERLALASKLDKELDEFINSLEKKRYTEGWPEDRWEEEMDKHPFFMKKAPEATDTLSPLVEGLQQLKYDSAENTAAELATNYKDDGNFNFKHKNYRLAIIGYTEGIKVKCDDNDVKASLYNNRSASHYFLGNYRSSFLDAQKALSFKPDHQKALLRAAECAMHISNYESCFQYCDEILERNFDNFNNDIALKIKRDAEKKKVFSERDQRKKEFKKKKHTTNEDEILKAITMRGIKIECNSSTHSFGLADLEPTFPGVADCRVHKSTSGDELIWPVLFLYPEYKMTDFIQNCAESSVLADQLAEMFEVTPEWDADRIYKMENLNMYYEGTKKYKLFKVDIKKTLGDVLKESNFELRAGTPAFIVMVRDSRVEKSFLQSYLIRNTVIRETYNTEDIVRWSKNRRRF